MPHTFFSLQSPVVQIMSQNVSTSRDVCTTAQLGCEIIWSHGFRCLHPFKLN